LSVDDKAGTARATAAFYWPLESLEIVRNGQVVGSASGDGQRAQLTLSLSDQLRRELLGAARTKARKDRE
jgi:hypothetical protein